MTTTLTITTILIFAACVAVLGGLAMRGTRSVTNPVSAAISFVVLPLIGAGAFVLLASGSGG